MTQVALSPAQTNELYEQLKAVPLDVWTKPSPGEIMASLKEAAQKSGKAEFPLMKDPERIGMSLSLFGRVAHEYGPEELADAVNHGRFPPLKLSSEEMELVRGGAVVTIGAGAVIGLAALAVSAVGLGIAIGVCLFD